MTLLQEIYKMAKQPLNEDITDSVRSQVYHADYEKKKKLHKKKIHKGKAKSKK